MSGDVRRCQEMSGDVRRCQEMSVDVGRCQEMCGAPLDWVSGVYTVPGHIASGGLW